MKKFSCILFITILMAACGGGGSESTPSPTPFPTPQIGIGELSGETTLSNGDVTVFTYESFRQSLVTTNTNSEGLYAIEIQSPRISIDIELSNGFYIEPATGAFININDNKLRAVSNYNEGEIKTLPITPFTHWASCYADYLINNGEPVSSAISRANIIFSSIFPFNIETTFPTDITDSSNQNTGLDEAAIYGYFIAAISSLTLDIANQDNAQPHRQAPYRSIDFIQHGCDDILIDGKLDGVTILAAPNSPQIPSRIGNVVINANHYRSLLAQHVLNVAMNDNINALGSSVQDLFNIVNRFSTSGHPIFGNLEPLPLDIDGPEITTSFDTTRSVAGQVTIPFQITDQSNLQSVEFFIDGISLGNPNSLDVIEFIFESGQFSNGFHNIRVEAVDTLGIESTFNFSLDFFNVIPTITVTSPTLVNDRNYIIAGTYREMGIPIDRIEVNGEIAELNPFFERWQLELRVEPGVNTLTAIIYDEIGNSNSITIDVALDNTRPSIDVIRTTTRVSNTIGTQFNICQLDNLINLNPNALCIRADNVSLNGQPVTQNLSNSDIWSVAIRFDDSPTREIFSTIDELIVEYQYSRENNGIIIDWTSAPRLGFLNDTSYIPITTEFLGSEFFITDVNEEHTINFRVTDEAGNMSIIPFTFRLNVVQN